MVGVMEIIIILTSRRYTYVYIVQQSAYHISNIRSTCTTLVSININKSKQLLYGNYQSLLQHLPAIRP